jgi:hypothetical protein
LNLVPPLPLSFAPTAIAGPAAFVLMGRKKNSREKTGRLLFSKPMAQQDLRAPRLEICLISQHPLVLEALRRLFTQARFHVDLSGLVAYCLRKTCK